MAFTAPDGVSQISDSNLQQIMLEVKTALWERQDALAFTRTSFSSIAGGLRSSIGWEYLGTIQAQIQHLVVSGLTLDPRTTPTSDNYFLKSDLTKYADVAEFLTAAFGRSAWDTDLTVGNDNVWIELQQAFAILLKYRREVAYSKSTSNGYLLNATNTATTGDEPTISIALNTALDEDIAGGFAEIELTASPDPFIRCTYSAEANGSDWRGSGDLGKRMTLYSIFDLTGAKGTAIKFVRRVYASETNSTGLDVIDSFGGSWNTSIGFSPETVIDTGTTFTMNAVNDYYMEWDPAEPVDVPWDGVGESTSTSCTFAGIGITDGTAALWAELSVGSGLTYG